MMSCLHIMSLISLATREGCALKVTPQVAAPGVEFAIYNSLVLLMALLFCVP